MSEVKTVKIDKQMIQEDPSGFSIIEGWDGVKSNRDDCVHGPLPRYIFPKHVNAAIQKMIHVMKATAKNTVHTMYNGRLHPDRIPERAGCYGTHQLLTAFGGLKLQYREGWVLKVMLEESKHPYAPTVNHAVRCWNERTGEMELQNYYKAGETRRRISLIHHGWCWDEERGEIVDITEGPHNGLKDGFIVPLVWQTVGNNATESRDIIRAWYRKQWKKQQYWIKKAIKRSMAEFKRECRRLGRSPVRGEEFEVKFPEAFKGAHMWMDALPVGFSRRAYYKGLHQVLAKFDVSHWESLGISSADAVKYTQCPKKRQVFAQDIVSKMWKKNGHFRQSSPEQWDSRMSEWSEVGERYFSSDVVLEKSDAEAA